MPLMYRHDPNDFVFEDNRPSEPVVLEEGPWRTEIAPPDQPPLPPELEARVLEALVRSRIEERYDAVRQIFCWGGGAPAPPWSRAEREAALKAWLATPPSPLRFYWVSESGNHWRLEFGGNSYWVTAVEGARECPTIFRPKLWTVDLSELPWVSRTRKDAERFGLPNPALSHGAPTLTEAYDQFLDAVVHNENRAQKETPLLPEIEYRRLLVVVCELWWELVDRIKAIKFPALPEGWESWKERSDEAFRLLREFEAKLGDRLREEGLPVLTLRIGEGRDLDESYAHFIQGIRLAHGLPLDGGELEELRRLERDCGGIPLGLKERPWVRSRLRSDPGLLEELEAHASPIRAAFLNRIGEAEDEWARLRNPSGADEAIARGWDCERHILATLERLGIRDSGLDPQWDAPPGTGGGLAVLAARQSALESAMPAGEAGREWINRQFADPRLGDLKPPFPTGTNALPEEFWSSIASERGTKHLDLLMAWRAGRCRELPAGEILPMAIASLAAGWWKSTQGMQGTGNPSIVPEAAPEVSTGPIPEKHSALKQAFLAFLETRERNNGFEALWTSFLRDWGPAGSMTLEEARLAKEAVRKSFSKLWEESRRASQGKDEVK